jgi:hypothetical protein
MQGRVLLCSRAPLRPCSPERCWAVPQTTDRSPPLCAGEHGCTGALFVAPWLLCSPAPLLLRSSAPLLLRSPAQEIAAGVRE